MLRALIIDDEAPARREMAYLLEQTHRVQICGEGSSVHEAVALIKSMPVDVVFLDIHMPGFNGLQLAESLKSHPSPPAVVFVTAYSKHALAAFDANAVDYLVKPVKPKRLEVALDKVVEMVANPPASSVGTEARIAVTKGNKKLLVDVCDVAYIMAKDDYSYLHTHDSHYLSTTSLTAFEKRLSGSNFFRSHRKYLVNLDWVSTVAPVAGGALTLTLKDDEQSEVPVSRRRVVELKQALDL